MKIESKIGTIPYNDEKIYNFLSDFNNFKNLIPVSQVENWESTKDSCSFEFKGVGKSGMKIIEKEPFKLIKIGAVDESKFDFFLWIQLKMVEDGNTKVKITIEPKINQMMAMMVKNPLQNFVDTLVDKMSDFAF